MKATSLCLIKNKTLFHFVFFLKKTRKQSNNIKFLKISFLFLKNRKLVLNHLLKHQFVRLESTRGITPQLHRRI